MPTLSTLTCNLWNSSLTKLICAARVRHWRKRTLQIRDACVQRHRTEFPLEFQFSVVPKRDVKMMLMLMMMMVVVVATSRTSGNFLHSTTKLFITCMSVISNKTHTWHLQFATTQPQPLPPPSPTIDRIQFRCILSSVHINRKWVSDGSACAHFTHNSFKSSRKTVGVSVKENTFNVQCKQYVPQVASVKSQEKKRNDTLE